MADKTRYFGVVMPEGADSVAASAGLTQINSFFDTIDTELQAVSNTGVAAYYLGVWTANNTPTLISTSTVSNSPLTWTNTITATGTGTPTFNTSTGMITFPTAGYYRVSYNLEIAGTTAPAEGYFKAGLKESGTAAFITRTAKQVPLDTHIGSTSIHNAMVIRAASSGADVNLTSSYNVTAIQENSGGVAATYNMTGEYADTWVAIEYVRAP